MSLERRKALSREGDGAKRFANSRSRLDNKASLKRSEMRRSSDPLPRSNMAKGSSTLKKTELARGTSQLERTELARGDSELERTELAPRSAKRQKHMTEERIPLIKALIAAGIGCEIGPVFAEAGLFNPDCSGQIQGMHERRKSGQGGSRVNQFNLIPACNSCNGLVETIGNTLLRERTGDALVVIEGDEEWERLGVRGDRDLTNDALDLIPRLVVE